MKNRTSGHSNFDFSFMFLALGIFTTEGEKSNNNNTIYMAPFVKLQMNNDE